MCIRDRIITAGVTPGKPSKKNFFYYPVDNSEINCDAGQEGETKKIKSAHELFAGNVGIGATCP